MRTVVRDATHARSQIGDRLAVDFGDLSRGTIDRWVLDAWRCVGQLGLDVTPWVVERVAREHLMAIVKSEPPSGYGPRLFP